MTDQRLEEALRICDSDNCGREMRRAETMVDTGFQAGAEIQVKVEGLGIVTMRERMRASAVYQLLCGPFDPDRILWRVREAMPLFDANECEEKELHPDPWIELHDGDHLVLAPRGRY